MTLPNLSGNRLTGEIFNQLVAQVHAGNARWWRDLDTGAPLARNIGEAIMLQVSELAEALEGHRKNLPDDKLPHRRMFEVEVADAMIRALDVAGGTGVVFGDWQIQRMPVPENVGEGLLHLTEAMGRTYTAFTVWAAKQQPHDWDYYVTRTWMVLNGIVDFAHHHRIDLWGAVEEKLAFNAVREDHTDAHRRSAHGKKY